MHSYDGCAKHVMRVNAQTQGTSVVRKSRTGLPMQCSVSQEEEMRRGGGIEELSWEQRIGENMYCKYLYGGRNCFCEFAVIHALLSTQLL